MSFAYETKSALSGVQIKDRCCKKAVLFGMLYASSDFAPIGELSEDDLRPQNEIRFSTDNEKCASLMTSMVRSLCRTDLLWEQVRQRSRRGKPQDYWHLLGGAEQLNTSLVDEFAAASEEITHILVCENCAKAFLRGLFLSVGTVVDPQKAYHLEFAVSDEKKCQKVCDYLCSVGFPVKITVRRGVRAIYLKDSEAVEDFFTFIGAPQTALAIMNAKILRDIRNNENRKANCDTANIFKSTGAAAAQIKAIKKLEQTGKLPTLPEPLRITAALRLEYPEVSLAELASLHEPPITKSGVTHRLAKLQAACDEDE